MKDEFDFESADQRAALALSQPESSAARMYIARVAEEDGAALVGHVARIRRGLSQLCADSFFDLTDPLRAVNPAAAAEVRAELEALLVGSQRLGNAAHALDIAAQRNHWACYYCPDAPEAAAAPDVAPVPASHPDVMEGETARDEDAPDIGQDLPDCPPASVPASARVAVSPAVADLAKIPVTDEGNRQRKQFWAVVKKQGLSNNRSARLKAISARLEREVISINTLTREEWQNVISGVEYQSLVW